MNKNLKKLLDDIEKPKFPIENIENKKCIGLKKLGKGDCNKSVFQNKFTGIDLCYDCFIIIMRMARKLHKITSCPAIVDGRICGKELHSKKLCLQHYTQLRRHNKISNQTLTLKG